MKAVTKNIDAGNAMAAEDEESDTPEDSQKSDKLARGSSDLPLSSPGLSTISASSGPSYFKIYKKGQGYWTRMGTVAGVCLVGLLTANFIWNEVTALGSTGSIAHGLARIHLTGESAGYIAVGIFSIGYALIAFHYLNKVKSVDFLIATDSEMKKVNWTTKKELIGSTKVVIGFMFVMASLLFLYDLFFQMLFWLLGVLKTPPFFLDKH